MILVRPATQNDVGLLPEIERSSGEVFRQWPGLEWIAEDAVQSEEQHRALIGNGISFVAEVDGWGVAAFLNGEMTSDALHIWQMAVHEQQQRRGIGRRLIAAAEHSAVSNGVNALTLTTFRNVPWNEPFYRSLGFIPLHRHELNSRLRRVLDAEEKAGLPIGLRCAMRKLV